MKKRKPDALERALASPVARAIAKRELQALHAQMAAVGDRCLQVAHESEQRELLASLAFMIGVGGRGGRRDTGAGRQPRGVASSP